MLLASEIPLLAARKQIASAIDIIVHLGRLRDKGRRVLEISEVLGCEGSEIKLRPLYCFAEHGEDENGRVLGALERTEARMENTRKLRQAGLSGERMADVEMQNRAIDS